MRCTDLIFGKNFLCHANQTVFCINVTVFHLLREQTFAMFFFQKKKKVLDKRPVEKVRQADTESVFLLRRAVKVVYVCRLQTAA